MNGIEPRATGGHGGTSGSRAARRRPSEHQRQLARAWERFIAGEDAVDGVRPHILLSWYRCRDLYRVDPGRTRAPIAHSRGTHTAHQDMIFAQLGGAAGVAANQVAMDDTLITVTDAEGRILASWGPKTCLKHGADSTLAPSYAWSEAASGTNGMGTSLERPGVAHVQGAEHWCVGFQQWRCAGVAVRDPVTQLPLAALNASRWGEDLPDEVSHWLRRTAAGVECELRATAIEQGARLADAFAELATGPARLALALDRAGKVVVASDGARQLLGVVCPVPSVEPHARLAPEFPELVQSAQDAIRWANEELNWQGFTELTAPVTGEALRLQLRPVRVAREVIGLLVTATEQPSGDYLGGADKPHRSRRFPPRIPAVRGSRIVLLGPHEIRYAQADCHDVWLVTDQGRLRAATRGIDHVEQLLNPATFLRVHRRYIVNISRIRELEYGFKGTLTVSTSAKENEAIPVSRRHVSQVRHALGL
jgi:sigma-54 dependent transcriptional regulator, acetoin dehydrogenase operon transcriptional activator AcoR